MAVVNRHFKYSGRLSDEDATHVASLSRAGIEKDHTQTDAMIQALAAPPNPKFAVAAMQALARLGERTALPSLDAYQPQSVFQNVDYLSYYATVAKARLLAEDSATHVADRRQRAITKVHVFFQELGVTPEEVTSRVAASHRPQIDADGRMRMSIGGGEGKSVELYAMRDLADMIYQDPDADFSGLPELSQVDFSQDYSAALKIRLATLSRRQRLATMITELSHKEFLRSEDDYEIQLAIDEGEPASQAAAAELRNMDTHREQYGQATHHTGFTALFRVIAGVGDPQQAPLIEHFQSDHDSWVAYYAEQVYSSVARGVKRERVIAY